MIASLVPIGFLAMCMLPLALAVVGVWVLKRLEARDERRSPLKEKLLHQPGSQARAKYNELGDEIMSRAVVLSIIGPVAMLAVLLPKVHWSQLRMSPLNWALVVGVFIIVAITIRQLVGLQAQRRTWREGMLAEMAVAQQLDHLRGEGLAVFHDLPAGQGFNIDHVVIGPRAVYAVETKSRRKHGQGRASAKVVYNGRTLVFAGRWTETAPLEQASAQARWLQDYLHGATGDTIPVIAVLCLPGWYVEVDKQAWRADVKVINPKMQWLFHNAAHAPGINAAQRTRIETALGNRYPELVVD